MLPLGAPFKVGIIDDAKNCPADAYLEPWMRVFKETELRIRPEHQQLPLFGSLVTALTDNVWVELMSVEELSRSGISAKDLASCAETEAAGTSCQVPTLLLQMSQSLFA